MFVKKIALNHYRNYTRFELKTESSVNIFVGANAQGKTNLLEAIYVLALTRSHRARHDAELIQWNEDQATLHCELEKKYGPCTLDLTISPQGKKAKINGLEQKKLSQYVGAMNVVLFAPEDLDIVKGSPGVRRRFLDMEIGQIYPAYLYDLSQYQRILQQRNNYLKRLDDPAAADPLLDAWNEQFVRYGIKIIKKRQSFINKLQSRVAPIHARLTGQSEKLCLQYRPSFVCEPSEDETVLFERYMVKLSQVKEQEIRRGMSLVGPHRDDLLFYINDMDVQSFGSQGQQRTTALSVKLAEIELIHEEIGDYPILLLDDVLSELDHSRQTQLIEAFQDKIQTFITTTAIEQIRLDRLHSASTFHIRAGSVVNE